MKKRLDFVLKDCHRSISSSDIMECQEVENRHSLSLPHRFYNITKQNYQLNPAVVYRQPDSQDNSRISSATLVSRTNAYLHKLHPEPQLVSLVGNSSLKPNDIFNFGLELSTHKDTYLSKSMPKPLQRYYSPPEKPQQLDFCEYCLGIDHIYLTCPEIPLSSSPWKPDFDRKEYSSTADPRTLCCYCFSVGHSSCFDHTINDLLWSKEKEREEFMDWWNNEIFSLEKYSETKSKRKPIIELTEEVDENDVDEVRIWNFVSTSINDLTLQDENPNGDLVEIVQDFENLHLSK